MNILCISLISLGLFFACTGGIGAIRLPDFYCRAHAVGVLDTLGTLLILGGLSIHYGFSIITAKLLVILVFLYLANPTITHVLVRAAVRFNAHV